jgi:hypothetical protein
VNRCGSVEKYYPALRDKLTPEPTWRGGGEQLRLKADRSAKLSIDTGVLVGRR